MGMSLCTTTGMLMTSANQPCTSLIAEINCAGAFDGKELFTIEGSKKAHPFIAAKPTLKASPSRCKLEGPLTQAMN